jgi:hypothetical protein
MRFCLITLSLALMPIIALLALASAQNITSCNQGQASYGTCAPNPAPDAFACKVTSTNVHIILKIHFEPQVTAVTGVFLEKMTTPHSVSARAVWIAATRWSSATRTGYFCPNSPRVLQTIATRAPSFETNMHFMPADVSNSFSSMEPVAK